ncbi:MAG TPA: SBBP repeat-containing protein, partial [Solirubrobacteraceae bacterium]|nr:SBBP repeat-containing protein [Solirubrobacteraceae bacterium]
ARRRGAIRLRFAGASAAPEIRAAGRAAGVVNVLRGRDPSRWRAGLHARSGVEYRGLYPGVDVRHDVQAGAGGPSPHSTFTVAAGADPRVIRWSYAGARTPAVDPVTGALRIPPRAGGPPLHLAAPVAWQTVDGRRVPVAVAYDVDEHGRVGFAAGRHDGAHPLMLGAAPAARAATGDPPAPAYATFLGGTNWDELLDVDAGAGGDAYVVGFTSSPDFPVAGARPSQLAGVMDAVVARLSPAGALVYSSYLGGDATDSGANIAVDGGGNAYVTGRTESEDFPVQAPLQRPLNGRRCQGEPCHDAFVAKLDAEGRIVYSTYLGGTGNEDGWGVAVDPSGRAYVTGNTDSDDFPTRNPVQDRNRSRGCAGDVPCPLETFVARLNAEGSALQYATYLGGRAGELSGGIAVDRRGAAYVTGTTRSPDFPVVRALQPEIKGVGCGPPPGVPCLDVYLTKLDPSGSAIEYSTYLGGTGSDRSGGVAVDRDGRAYLTGSTASPDFPTAHPVQGALDDSSCRAEEPQESCNDAFVTGLSTDGARLAFSTYLGGNAEDQGLGVALDAKGVVHVAGLTDSRRFPVAHAPQAALGGRTDGFVTRYAAGGRSVLSSTFLGGKKDERLSGLAADPSGASLVAGVTSSPDFPTASPFQAAHAGDLDGVVARLR